MRAYIDIYPVPHACSAGGGQKRAVDSLELELQMVVRGYVGAGN